MCVCVHSRFSLIPGNDLDSIRALFSEKEKELSLAVAKVEALTKQLEELRRDRRGPLNLISPAAGASLKSANGVVSVNSLNLNGSNNNGTTNIQQQLNTTSTAARELDKLRRELMVRKQIFYFSIIFFSLLRYQETLNSFSSRALNRIFSLISLCLS